MNKVFVFVALASVLFAWPVSAESESHATSTPEAAASNEYQADENKIKTAVSKEEDVQNARQKSQNLVKTLTKDLSPVETGHFERIYSTHSLIGTVKSVRKNVETGIIRCGENNPGMKTIMDERFTGWDGAVTPLLEEAQGNLNNMIIAQDYADKKDIDAVLNTLDDMRKHAENTIDRVPVSTPEACLALQNTMDDTQDNMLKILRSTLITLPKSYHDDHAQDGAKDNPDENNQTL